MSLQIYVQLKTREINNKDIIMKKLLKLAATSLCLTSLLSACGGGSSNSTTSAQQIQNAPCYGVDLGLDAPKKINAGMTIEEANAAIGCPADKVAEEPVTYSWSDGAADHFGVNLHTNGQVNGIFVFDDWITCPDQEFTTSMIDELIGPNPMTTPVTAADYVVQCKGQVKAIDFDLSTGTSSGVIQYLNGNGKEINVIFKDGAILSAVILNSPVKGQIPYID